jgi:hypothetical protein
MPRDRSTNEEVSCEYVRQLMAEHKSQGHRIILAEHYLPEINTVINVYGASMRVIAHCTREEYIKEGRGKLPPTREFFFEVEALD